MGLDKQFVVGLLAIAFLLIISEKSSACSCARETSSCNAFGATDAVFIGKVIGAKEQKTVANALYNDSLPANETSTFDVGEIHFQVEEAFQGTNVRKGRRVTIHSGTGGGDCGYWFKRGETYLVYAYGNDKKGYGTNICTRTREISHAQEDLEFLRNLPRQRAGVRIYGQVAEMVKNPSEEGWRQAKPMSAITLKIQQVNGKRHTFEAVTDALGNYEVTNLPAGKYKVVPTVPSYGKVDSYDVEEFDVNDRGCAERNFAVENNSQIAGRVIDSEGRPVKDIWIELIPILDEQKKRNDNDQDLTNEKGEFALERIPVGSYVLAVNYIYAPDEENPFPTTFYPNASEKTKATVIEIGAGQKLRDIEFQLPHRLLEQTIQGSVIWDDGSAASEIGIHIEDLERLGYCVNGCSSKTDKQGNFILRGYLGRSYRIRASGEKVIGEQKKEFFADLQTFVLKGEMPLFKVILNRNDDPTKKDESKEETSP